MALAARRPASVPMKSRPPLRMVEPTATPLATRVVAVTATTHPIRLTGDQLRLLRVYALGDPISGGPLRIFPLKDDAIGLTPGGHLTTFYKDAAHGALVDAGLIVFEQKAVVWEWAGTFPNRVKRHAWGVAYLTPLGHEALATGQMPTGFFDLG